MLTVYSTFTEKNYQSAQHKRHENLHPTIHHKYVSLEIVFLVIDRFVMVIEIR